MTVTGLTPLPDLGSAGYRDAYSRVNGVVVVGEGLADRHFRLLARAIPADRADLLRLAAMEGRHARDFVGCGKNLGIQPDAVLAKRLFAPLHALFLDCDRQGDLAGCLTIQGLIIECFAVAAYRHYLPVSDPYARTITATVLMDEAEHLAYAEQWLQRRFTTVQPAVTAICRRALPVTLQILQVLVADLQAIGIDPFDLVASFQELFQAALVGIGYGPATVRRLLVGAAASLTLS